MAIKIFYLPISKHKTRIWDWAARTNVTVKNIEHSNIVDNDTHALYTVTYGKGGNTDKPRSPGILMMVNKGGSLNKKRSMI